MDLRIIPTPQVVLQNYTDFKFENNFAISISDDNDNLNYCAQLLSNTIMKKIKALVTITSDENSTAAIELRIIDEDEMSQRIPDSLKNESYRILINNNKILVESISERGIFYACMSLIQIFEKSQNHRLPGVEIIDYPDFKVRGISDDISRGQVSKLENFKKIIREISRYKINTYMPYIEDVLELEAFPSIGKNRGALTKAEVKELIAYAEKHFVEVIPIFQTLGHYENILAMEEFLKYAEFPGSASLNVSNEETYVFIESMLKEVFELFPSEYFHMGADESYDVGLHASKKLVRKSSIAEVHAAHYQRVYDICRKYNKKVIMYGDIILNYPDILELLPKDITIVDWHYGASNEYSSTATFNNAGFRYYVSPSVWNFTSTFPNYSVGLPNITNIIKEGKNNNAAGMISSNWGDFGAETIKEFLLFGYAYSAQCAWNFEQTNIGNFSHDYFYDFFGIDDSRLSAIYENFSMPYNQIYWSELWRHPLLDFREPKWWETNLSPVARIDWMEWTEPGIKKTIDELESRVLRNRDHFNLFRFLIDLNAWYRLKLRTQFILHKKINDEEIDLEMCGKLIDENIDQIDKLKKAYKKLWLTYYKKDNLWMIEDKFERLQQYFVETKTKLMDDEIVDPLLSSEWIYYSNSKRKGVKNAKFRKTFTISGDIINAQLQLMADTYAQLFINNKLIEKVYVKRSLSLVTEYDRVKFFNITDYLKKGKNTIEVIAEKFQRSGSAGINIIAQIESENETELIQTNDTWRVKSLGTKRGSWKKAMEIEYPYKIIAPNFETGRPSWIER
ncbi:MAG: family 20 glycosylhydrolase [Ignavibacteriae bacterium]|nr:family 20 glycosylhydrolase [Ignavibacteriota bacterium]